MACPDVARLTYGHTDRRMDGQTDGQGDSYIAPHHRWWVIITPVSVFLLNYSIKKASMPFIVHRLSAMNDKAS